MTTVDYTHRGAEAERAFASDRPSLIVPAARMEGVTRIAITWQAAVNYLVPCGYEDVTGFHFGEMPSSIPQLISARGY